MLKAPGAKCRYEANKLSNVPSLRLSHYHFLVHFIDVFLDAQCTAKPGKNLKALLSQHKLHDGCFIEKLCRFQLHITNLIVHL